MIQWSSYTLTRQPAQKPVGRPMPDQDLTALENAWMEKAALRGDER